MIARLLIAGLLVLCGCATLDTQCNMAIPENSKHMAPEGETLVVWRFDPASTNCQPTSYGCAECSGSNPRVCFITLKFTAPDFNDVCKLARLGHEVGHALGAMHASSER